MNSNTSLNKKPAAKDNLTEKASYQSKQSNMADKANLGDKCHMADKSTIGEKSMGHKANISNKSMSEKSAAPRGDLSNPIADRSKADADNPGSNTIRGFAARRVALRLLGAVLQKKTSLEALIDNNYGHAQYLALSKADKKLCRAIIYHVLRYHLLLQSELKLYLKNDLPPRAWALRHVIYIGAVQLRYLRVKPHAAIYLSVALAKSDPRLRRFAALVNAILRQFAAHSPPAFDVLKHSPSWYKNMLEADYGPAKARSIIEAQYGPCFLELSLKDPSPANCQYWADKLNAEILPGGSLRLREQPADITALPGFASGQFFVQNFAASLAVKLMGEISGQKIIDLCASPGGKSLQIASQSADLYALELHERRFLRLKENFARLALPAQLICADFTKLLTERPELKENFNIALLDIPCSSTGTIARHIDILYNKDLAAISSLAQNAVNLLRAALDFVKPSGLLYFSNCSLAKKEGSALIKDFVKSENIVKIVKIDKQKFQPFSQFITSEGFLRILPGDKILDNIYASDGAFVAILQKMT